MMENAPADRTFISKSATMFKGGSILPVDIEYDIIDQVQDQPTLASCSLVSRAWMEVSRSRLFHTVILRGDGRIRGFLLTLQEQETTSSTPVSRHIRQLTFIGKGTSFFGSGRDAPLPLGLLCALLNQVPRVTHLAFHEVQITEDFPPSTKDGVILPSRDSWCRRPLRSLLINGLFTSFETPLVLTNLVSLFDSIHFLGIFMPGKPENTHQSAFKPFPPVSIRSLSIVCLPSTVATPLYDLLHKSGTFDGSLKYTSVTLLDGLEVLYPSQVEYETPTRILRHAGPHLRVLELRLTWSFLTSRDHGMCSNMHPLS